MLDLLRRDDVVCKIRADKANAGFQTTLLLLTVKNQIKVQHWRTRSYAEHVALDNLFSDLSKKNDEWVEVFQGKYGRVSFESDDSRILLFNSMGHDYLKRAANNLQKLKQEHFDGPEDSDLASIFDDICGLYHKYTYLLTLS